jgi:hypothetical protein
MGFKMLVELRHRYPTFYSMATSLRLCDLQKTKISASGKFIRAYRCDTDLDFWDQALHRIAQSTHPKTQSSLSTWIIASVLVAFRKKRIQQIPSSSCKKNSFIHWDIGTEGADLSKFIPQAVVAAISERGHVLPFLQHNRDHLLIVPTQQLQTQG